jgi:hypothetical protein
MMAVRYGQRQEWRQILRSRHTAYDRRLLPAPEVCATTTGYLCPTRARLAGGIFWNNVKVPELCDNSAAPKGRQNCRRRYPSPPSAPCLQRTILL